MPEGEAQPPISYTLNLFADYYQFYLRDEVEAEEDQPADWGDLLVTQMIAVAPGIIGVGTARNTRVPVSIDVVATRPDDDFTGWDRVTEASLEVPSGRIVVAGTSDYFPEAQRIPVPPGSYRVRICSGGLGSISANGLDGEDHYHVVIWPEGEAEDRPPVILKKWGAL